jgi:protein-S-isoprenylcysteine O-methyltransferase Ste14
MSSLIKTLFLVVTLLAEGLTSLALLLGLAIPRLRTWPPRREHAWGGPAMLGLFLVAGAGVVGLGIADWGSLRLAAWARTAVGGPLWLGGNLLALWAIVTLGPASTAGGEKGLIRRGPYRFSRNPQYAGFILALAGWTLLTGSLLAGIASLGGMVPLLLVPFAEEPWLEERYGAAYAEYKREVGRFLTFRK